MRRAARPEAALLAVAAVGIGVLLVLPGWVALVGWWGVAPAQRSSVVGAFGPAAAWLVAGGVVVWLAALGAVCWSALQLYRRWVIAPLQLLELDHPRPAPPGPSHR